MKSKALSTFLLALISFGVFAVSLKNGFVWDDIPAIKKSYYSFKSENIKSHFIPQERESKRQSGYYRPVIFFSFFLDYKLWGLFPLGFHLSNVVFHTTSVVLFYLLLLLILKGFGTERRERIAFFSSLLFALHPMHVESVSWIAGRTDVLCTLFLFLAFIFHLLSHTKKPFLTLAVLFFYLSLISKEVALIFPLVALAYDFLSLKTRKKPLLLNYALYGALVGLYVLLKSRVHSTILPELSSQAELVEGTSLFEYMNVIFASYFLYLKKLVFPTDFNAFMSEIPTGLLYIVSSITVLTTVSILFPVLIKARERTAAFALLWILITISPSLLVTVFTIAATPFAERYLYLPSAGFSLLLAYLLIKLGEKLQSKWVGYTLLIALSLFYLTMTVKRDAVWRNDLSLWRDTVEKAPREAFPHTNYGMALKDAGRIDEAIEEFLKALSPRVRDNQTGRAITAGNLGLAYMNKDDYVRAKMWFHRSLGYNRQNKIANYHLGLLYFIIGEEKEKIEFYETSEKYLKESLAVEPNYARAHLLLGKVYIKLGKGEAAKEYAKRALRLGLIEPLAEEARRILEVDN